jgi:hypothetical protein
MALKINDQNSSSNRRGIGGDKLLRPPEPPEDIQERQVKREPEDPNKVNL